MIDDLVLSTQTSKKPMQLHIFRCAFVCMFSRGNRGDKRAGHTRGESEGRTQCHAGCMIMDPYFSYLPYMRSMRRRRFGVEWDVLDSVFQLIQSFCKRQPVFKPVSILTQSLRSL